MDTQQLFDLLAQDIPTLSEAEYLKRLIQLGEAILDQAENPDPRWLASVERSQQAAHARLDEIGL